MSARDLIQEALHSLEANKGRSLLTILGIVIGIASVIAMTSLIGGILLWKIEKFKIYFWFISCMDIVLFGKRKSKREISLLLQRVFLYKRHLTSIYG